MAACPTHATILLIQSDIWAAEIIFTSFWTLGREYKLYTSGSLPKNSLFESYHEAITGIWAFGLTVFLMFILWVPPVGSRRAIVTYMYILLYYTTGIENVSYNVSSLERVATGGYFETVNLPPGGVSAKIPPSQLGDFRMVDNSYDMRSLTLQWSAVGEDMMAAGSGVLVKLNNSHHLYITYLL